MLRIIKETRVLIYTDKKINILEPNRRKMETRAGLDSGGSQEIRTLSIISIKNLYQISSQKLDT